MENIGSLDYKGYHISVYVMETKHGRLYRAESEVDQGKPHRPAFSMEEKAIHMARHEIDVFLKKRDKYLEKIKIKHHKQ